MPTDSSIPRGGTERPVSLPSALGLGRRLDAPPLRFGYNGEPEEEGMARCAFCLAVLWFSVAISCGC